MMYVVWGLYKAIQDDIGTCILARNSEGRASFSLPFTGLVFQTFIYICLYFSPFLALPLAAAWNGFLSAIWHFIDSYSLTVPVEYKKWVILLLTLHDIEFSIQIIQCSSWARCLAEHLQVLYHVHSIVEFVIIHWLRFSKSHSLLGLWGPHRELLLSTTLIVNTILNLRPY